MSMNMYNGGTSASEMSDIIVWFVQQDGVLWLMDWRQACCLHHLSGPGYANP